MSSWAGYFARTSDAAAAERAFGPTALVADSPWVVSGHGGGASPPADDVLWGRASLTAAKSGQLGEVVYLYADRSTEFPEREAEVRRAWQERLLVSGSTIPSADASVALLVERHFDLKRPPLG